MKEYILAVDDEPLMLLALTKSLEKVFRRDAYEIESFDEVADVLEFLESSGKGVVYAFLDVKLRGMLGIDLAQKVREFNPGVRIIFCTAYAGFTMDAFNVCAVGYLLKPITEEKVRNVLTQLNLILPEQAPQKDLSVQTFGNFAVFYHGHLIPWKRQKAQELFAFLIDRRGAPVSNREIALTLWEDDSKVRNVQTILSSLRQTLKEAGCEDILIRTRNQTSLDISKIECDLYDFLAGDEKAISKYQGEYMSNYSWAEFTNGVLYTQRLEEQSAYD